MMSHDAGFPDPGGHPPRAPHPVAGRIEAGGHHDPEGSEQPAALAAAPDVLSLLRALHRRWIAAVLVGGTLACVAALTAWSLLSPKYTALAQVRVLFTPPHIIPRQGESSQAQFNIYQKTAAAQLISRPVIWAALKRDEVRRLNLEATEADPVATISEDLKIEMQEGNEVVTVLFSHRDPAVATTVLKAITEAYMDEIAYAERRVRTEQVSELEKVLGDEKNDLKTKKDNLRKLANRLGGADPAARAAEQFQLVSDLKDAKHRREQVRFELVRTQADLEAHDAKVKALANKGIPEAAIEHAVLADPDLKELRTRISKLREVVEGYGGPANSPTLLASRQRLHDLDRTLKQRRNELRAELKNQAESGGDDSAQLTRIQLQNRVKTLQDLHEKAVAEVEQLVAQQGKQLVLSPEYESLRDDILTKEKHVGDMLMQLDRQQVELRAAQRTSIYQPAELQKKDVKKQMMATVASPLAVLLTVCTGLAWTEFRKRRIRSAGEVSRGLGIRVVGAVPDLPNLEQYLIGPGGEPDLDGHPVLESIDAIRTLLLRDHEVRATRVVLVTSAINGEGKTTLASHLAGSLARAGRKTLLLDGDLRDPAAHQLFDLPMQPGFSEVLLGEVEVADAVQPTPLDGLALMSAGQWDREVLHALARDGLEGILEKLKEEFDFIVIDSHPVLPAADSLLLGQQADAVILSVLREVSQMPRVYAAAQRLQALGIRVLGAVMNGTDPEEVFTSPGRPHALAS